MAEEDNIIKRWNDAAEAWSEFVREGKDYFRDELNNPAAFKLIGNVKGKRVLHLACGEGYNTRFLAEKGATVVSVDFSERLIELARRVETEQRLGTAYYISDAAHMSPLQSASFDIVTYFVSLQDIEHYEGVISEVARFPQRRRKVHFFHTSPMLRKPRKGRRNNHRTEIR